MFYISTFILPAKCELQANKQGNTDMGSVGALLIFNTFHVYAPADADKHLLTVEIKNQSTQMIINNISVRLQVE